MRRLVHHPSIVSALPDKRIADISIVRNHLLGMPATCSPNGVLSRIDCSIVVVPGQMIHIYVSANGTKYCDVPSTSWHFHTAANRLAKVVFPEPWWISELLNMSSQSPCHDTYRFSEDNEAYRFPSQNLQLSL